MTEIINKNIKFNKSDYELIKENAKKRHMTISEFINSSALQRIKEDDELDLFEYLDKYCEPCSKEEQEDIEKFLKDYDFENDEFVEITIDDVLNNKI